MLVPWSCVHVPWRDGTDEKIPTPGAVTSGLSRSETVVGPPDEKGAITPAFVAAATVIALGVFAGEPTEPKPEPSKSLPAATTGITPAAAAPSSARTTRSRAGSTSG